MRYAFAVLLAAGLAAGAPSALADGTGDPGTTHAEFDAARVRDDLRGVIDDPAKEVRITFFASAGSTLSAKLTGDETLGSNFATGLVLVLCRADGTDLGVPGSPADKSKPGKDQVKWKNVALDTTGEYVLIVRVGTAGGWRLTLNGALSKLKQTTDSTAPLDVGVEECVEFQGLAGGIAKFKLRPRVSNRFKGETCRVEGPDQQPLDMEVGDLEVEIEMNGTHKLYFLNSGKNAGDWTVTVTSKPPSTKKRTGEIRTDGAFLVPKIKKLDPARGVQTDTEAEVIINGRDFQPDADVRLTRKGFADIVAHRVEFVTENQVVAEFDLDTSLTPDGNSLGQWRFGFWNGPTYTNVNDPSTLEKQSLTRDTRKNFKSVSEASVTLPRGIQKKSEVWFVEFNNDFQEDLNRMGLGSPDGEVRFNARTAVEAYVILFLRDVFGANETTGKLKKNKSIFVSFIVKEPKKVAGRVGVDYNRIEVGGEFMQDDERDVTEPLLWGFAPFDAGNANRENLTVEFDDGLPKIRRIGHGARTRSLDPDDANASQNWINAMAPLRQSVGAFPEGELTFVDRQYFRPGFAPRNKNEADRYAVIVTQLERASREIAAQIAHHIGRAMGLSTAGIGPMAAPQEAGDMWRNVTTLSFSAGDYATLQANAVPHELPGKGGKLDITYFPLISTQPTILIDMYTNSRYSTDWDFVGGRPNAVASDYSVRYGPGSNRILGLSELDFIGIRGTAPLFIAPNTLYCGIAVFQTIVTDNKRNRTRRYLYQLSFYPNPADPGIPAPLLNSANNCAAQFMRNGPPQN